MSTKAKKGITLKTRNALTGYLFMLPWIIGFLAFTLYPLIFSIRLAFNQVDLSNGLDFSFQGFKYFKTVWGEDVDFKLNLAGTLTQIGFSTPVILVLALIIALLLNNKFPLRTLYRVIFFFPVVVMSGPAISELLSAHYINFSQESPAIFQFLGMMPKFLQTPVLYVLNNLVLILWFSGVQILIFLAGLQKISPDIYDAAAIDGAGAWEKFWKITLPFVAPMILLNAVYTIIDIANYANNSVNKQISGSIVSSDGLYSLSAAMSWIYFLIIVAILLALMLVVWLFTRRSRS